MLTTRQAGRSQNAALQAPHSGAGRASRAALKGLSFAEGEAQLAPGGDAGFEMTSRAGGDPHLEADHPGFDVDTLRAEGIAGRLGAGWAMGGMVSEVGGLGAGLPGMGGAAGMPGLGTPGMGIPGIGERLGGAGGGVPGTGVPGLGGPGRLGGSLAGVLNGFGGGPHPGKELPTGGFGADPRLAAGGSTTANNGATSAEMLSAMAAGQAWGTADELEGDAMQEIGRAVLGENPDMTPIQRAEVKQQFDLEAEITAEESEAVTAAAEAVTGGANAQGTGSASQDNGASGQGTGSGSQDNGASGSATTTGSTSNGTDTGGSGQQGQSAGSGTPTSDAGTTTDAGGTATPNVDSDHVAGGVKSLSRAARIRHAVNSAKFGQGPQTLTNPGRDGVATAKKQGRERMPRSTKLDTLILKEGGDTVMPGIATGRRPIKGGGVRPPDILTQPGGPDTSAGQPTLGGSSNGSGGHKPDD